MLAFSLSLAIVLILALLGLAIMPKSVANFDKPLAIFLSPILGLSVIMLVLFSINRLGLPIRNSGPAVTLLIIIVIIFRRKQVLIQFINCLNTIKLLAATIGILFTGWPMLKYGFSWLSYVNDDMNNYVLAANRFLNSGFFSQPSADYFLGKDYSQLYYNMHVVNHVRSGSEIYLAFVSSITQLPPIKIFMPSIIALQMMLIFATLALTRLSRHRSKRLTRISYLLSILMSMMSLGYLYQLIAQVGGIAVGIAFISFLILFLRIEGPVSKKSGIVVLAGCIMGTQLIWYPEFLPFVSLISVGLLFRNRSRLRKQDALVALFFLSFVIITLNQYFFQAILFGISQASSAQGSITGVNPNAQLFPYFLNPHGLTSYLGLAPLNVWFSEPWESLTVVFSSLVLAGVLYYSIRIDKLSSATSISFLILFSAFCYLVITANGFGAFKISMFVAPFLTVLFAEIIDLNWRASRLLPKFILAFIFVIFAVLNIRTAQFYANASTGTSSNGFNEIQNGSNQDFTGLIKEAFAESGNPSRDTISTAVNLSQIKLEAIGANGFPLFFATSNPFDNVFDSTPSKGKMGYIEVTYNTRWGVNSFIQPRALLQNPDEIQYLVSRNKFDSLNRSSLGNVVEPWSYKVVNKPKNFVSFVNSSMGPTYYRTKNRQEAVLFQPEKNPLIPERFMQSVGDHLLLQVSGLSANPVLVMNVSSTVLSQYDRKIPKIYIQGMNVQEIDVLGYGSGQFNLPLGKPLSINGLNYYHLHISRELAAFPQKSSFVSRIYGEEFELDARRITMFLNNLSIVDRDILQKSSRQKEVSEFPTSILNNELNYSGAYEDGWVGSNSYFELSDKGSSVLILKGSVPTIYRSSIHNSTVTISIDGKKLVARTIQSGDFSITVPWIGDLKGKGTRRVAIQFSNQQNLPSPDNRPVSAQISFIGFK